MESLCFCAHFDAPFAYAVTARSAPKKAKKIALRGSILAFVAVLAHHGDRDVPNTVTNTPGGGRKLAAADIRMGRLCFLLQHCENCEILVVRRRPSFAVVFKKKFFKYLIPMLDLRLMADSAEDRQRRPWRWLVEKGMANFTSQ